MHALDVLGMPPRDGKSPHVFTPRDIGNAPELFRLSFHPSSPRPPRGGNQGQFRREPHGPRSMEKRDGDDCPQNRLGMIPEEGPNRCIYTSRVRRSSFPPSFVARSVQSRGQISDAAVSEDVSDLAVPHDQDASFEFG